MTSKHRFILRPYKSVTDRETCPRCHGKRCFSRYIDIEGKIDFPPYVGRCNREHKCGYHYTPRQYFLDHPGQEETARNNPAHNYPYREPDLPEPVADRFYFPHAVMEQSMNHYDRNNFYLFLKSRYGEKAALGLMEKYHIGTAKVKTGSCVFWQVDSLGRVCQGKIMLYDASTGKRSHEIHPTWAHKHMNIDKERIGQCFFGEHLLADSPGKPIGIVESEKSAVIASFYLPDYVWIASGGKDGMFSKANLDIFKGRTVVLFPDLGMTGNWQVKAARLRTNGIDARVFTYLEEHASDFEKENGLDIADYLLNEHSQAAILRMMIAKNPCIQTLIDRLDLELVSPDAFCVPQYADN